VTTGTATFPAIAANGGTGVSDSPHFLYRVDPTVACGTVIDFTLHAVCDQDPVGTDSAFTMTVGQGGASTNTHVSVDVPKTIGDSSTVTSIITVADTTTVLDVNVTIRNITHTFDGDLDVFLIGPNGTRVELTTDNGGTGENFVDTVFDDEATNLITGGTAPFTGSFKPEGVLSLLDGIPANGTWTLEITDDAGGDTGTLTAWSLTLTTEANFTCDVCTPGGLPPGETGGTPATHVKWIAGTTYSMEWGENAAADHYHVYRGTPASLPDLLTANADSCKRLDDVMTESCAGLTETPASGSFFWYLVVGWNAAGDGSSGSATNGPRQLNSTGPCS
jgi:subtilisin-like proprotein convertase family protein